MNRFSIPVGLVMFMATTVFGSEKHDGFIKPVPFTAVHVHDNFWSQRLDTLRTKTIRYAFEKSEKAGYIDNFAIAGGLKAGKYQSLYPFDDAEVFKIVEGASYLLMVKKDPELETYIDSLVSIIVAAQEPDGYLFTNKTINNPLHPWVGANRWENDWNLSHETFNAGELYEAAIAYYYATGKRQLLDAAIKNADLICDVFHENGIVMSPGHAVIEMALVRLYEATGNKKYLKQARFFLECRGRRKHDATSGDLRNNGEYWQDHLPAVQQREAVGHAVRALYFYSGMADIAFHMVDKDYLEAVDGIWDNIVGKKMYLTGGLGSTAHNEAFGKNYELPNATAYCETCASIANCMFNLRMFRLHGEAKYFDVLERSLYNTVLSGISLSGDQFFYPNVLEADRRGQKRSLWFGCSCCPTNLSRFIPAIPGYVYATDEHAIYTNLFISSTSEIDFNGKKVELQQTTDYPWEGEIEIKIEKLETSDFDLKIRIPGWADGKAVPSDLYKYIDSNKGRVNIKINGAPCTFKKENGYAILEHGWKKGDKIKISLPMEVHQVVSHKAVRTNDKLTAVERGPLVYCAEFADNGGSVFNLSLDEGADFKIDRTNRFLNGAYVISGTGKRYTVMSDKHIKEVSTTVNLIPYYARAYRGAGEMKVWLPLNGNVIKQNLYDESRIVDEVIVGNPQSEEKHNLQGENTRSDESGGWRDAENGWFSYDLNISSNQPMELVLTFHSTDGVNRTFEIWIDEYKIGEQSLRTETFDALIDKVYQLPVDLLRGKKKVTVKLKSLPGNVAGGVFGCKMRIQDNK